MIEFMFCHIKKVYKSKFVIDTKGITGVNGTYDIQLNSHNSASAFVANCMNLTESKLKVSIGNQNVINRRLFNIVSTVLLDSIIEIDTGNTPYIVIFSGTDWKFETTKNMPSYLYIKNNNACSIFSMTKAIIKTQQINLWDKNPQTANDKLNPKIRAAN